MSAFNAGASMASPSWKSMARTVLLSRRVLNSPFGSCSWAPFDAHRSSDGVEGNLEVGAALGARLIGDLVRDNAGQRADSLTMSSSPRRPILSPSLDRGTVVILSMVGRWWCSLGSLVHRHSRRQPDTRFHAISNTAVLSASTMGRHHNFGIWRTLVSKNGESCSSPGGTEARRLGRDLPEGLASAPGEARRPADLGLSRWLQSRQGPDAQIARALGFKLDDLRKL
jgi:hypothetical protein